MVIAQYDADVRPPHSRQFDVLLAEFFDLAVDLLTVAGFDGYFKAVTPAWSELLGYSDEDLLSRPYLEFVHPDDRDATSHVAAAMVHQTQVGTFENRLVASDGSVRWMRWKFRPNAPQALVYGIARDVTDEKMHAQVERARAAVISAIAASSQWDEAIDQVIKALCDELDWCAGERWSLTDGRWHRTRPWSAPSPRSAGDRVHGTARDADGLPADSFDLALPVMRSICVGSEVYPHTACKANKGTHGAVGFVTSSERGGIAALRFLTPGSRVAPDGLTEFLQGVGLQLTVLAQQLDAGDARRRVRELGQATLEHRATHDGLTGLPNRELMVDRVQTAVRSARRTRTGVAVMMIDLNGFKAINDTHGHEVGDDVLREVAARLKAALRESDTVGRIGGDEFAVLAVGDVTAAGAAALAAKICSAFDAPLAGVAYGATVGLSVGVALFPDHARDTMGLLRCADRAMYSSKAHGIGWTLFEDSMVAGRPCVRG